jgi:hypothetical protein
MITKTQNLLGTTEKVGPRYLESPEDFPPNARAAVLDSRCFRGFPAIFAALISTLDATITQIPAGNFERECGQLALRKSRPIAKE